MRQSFKKFDSNATLEQTQIRNSKKKAVKESTVKKAFNFLFLTDYKED